MAGRGQKCDVAGQEADREAMLMPAAGGRAGRVWGRGQNGVCGQECEGHTCLLFAASARPNVHATVTACLGLAPWCMCAWVVGSRRRPAYPFQREKPYKLNRP
eukprot:353674-Chlamydomonas_euryale.AAC.6